MFSIWCVLSNFERHCEAIVWERDFGGVGETDCPRGLGGVRHTVVYMLYQDGIMSTGISESSCDW